MRGNPKLGPFEGVGNENLDFQKGASTFWALFKWPLAKILTFRGGLDFFGPKMALANARAI